MKINGFLITGIISTIVFVFIHLDNDYMQHKTRKCIVLDKMTSMGGYKYSGNFYLVLKEERGFVLDIIVTPATFSQTKIGDTKYFDLREYDIKQSGKENFVYFFLPIIFLAISVVFTGIGLLLMFL